MPSYVTAKKNVAFVMYVGLVDQADTKLFKANPTLAAGDVKVSIDGAALANITTLPDAEPDSGKLVRVQLSADEMNGDNIQVVFSDAAGAEWCDLIVNIQTTARQVDDLAYPTTSGRSLDISAGGEAGIDWANIGSPTTTVGLSGTTVKTATDVETDTADIQSRLPAALVGGRIDSDVGNISAGGLADVQVAVEAGVAVVLTATLADSIPADGTRPSIAQALYMITQFLMERSVSGTTVTVKKADGSTTLLTLTLNSATAPTSITRAT